MKHPLCTVPARALLGFIAACVSAVGLYAVLRVIQWRMFPDANPATVIWSAHAGYFWRCWTASYAGAMVGFLAYAAARRHPGQVVRALGHALTVATVLIVFQAVVIP